MYGSSRAEQSSLRAGRGGRLRAAAGPDGPLLPGERGADGDCDGETCFLAGDSRVNEVNIEIMYHDDQYWMLECSEPDAGGVAHGVPAGAQQAGGGAEHRKPGLGRRDSVPGDPQAAQRNLPGVTHGMSGLEH